jgi:hypothetical protein
MLKQIRGLTTVESCKFLIDIYDNPEMGGQGKIHLSTLTYVEWRY